MFHFVAQRLILQPIAQPIAQLKVRLAIAPILKLPQATHLHLKRDFILLNSYFQ